MPITYSCVNEGATMLGECAVGEQSKPASNLQLIFSYTPINEFRRKTVEDHDPKLLYFCLCNGKGRIVGCVGSSDVSLRTAHAYLEAVEPLVRDLPADAATDGAPQIRNVRICYRRRWTSTTTPSTSSH